VSERIHDDEHDTSEATVRALLAAQCPGWSELSVSYLRTSGTDNAMWRVNVPDGADVVVRLPRRAGAAKRIGQELNLLRAISDSSISKVVNTPTVRHVGEPEDAFPHRWAVLAWLHGSDAWSARHELDGELDDLAIDLAQAVRAIGRLSEIPAPHRDPGYRGGPVEPLLHRLDRWLDDPRWNAPRLVDVASVRRSAAESLEVSGEPVAIGFVHGDLIPGNLLTERRRLSAIIDWAVLPTPILRRTWHRRGQCSTNAAEPCSKRRSEWMMRHGSERVRSNWNMPWVASCTTRPGGTRSPM
jgi:aminoglycoside phosphotransferase (APT) family kinase protein